jgi:hypothetical protein
MFLLDIFYRLPMLTKLSESGENWSQDAESGARGVPEQFRGRKLFAQFYNGMRQTATEEGL